MQVTPGDETQAVVTEENPIDETEGNIAPDANNVVNENNEHVSAYVTPSPPE
jgi:hypothetical protein